MKCASKVLHFCPTFGFTSKESFFYKVVKKSAENQPKISREECCFYNRAASLTSYV